LLLSGLTLSYNVSMTALLHSPDCLLDPAAPVVEELIPTRDAWDVARRLAGCPRLLFLDSAQSHPTLGRFSFVTADPFDWIESRGNRITTSGREEQSGDPFSALSRRLAEYSVASHPDLPPFQGGAAGLFGYDLCHHIERLPRPRTDEFQTPDMAVGIYDWVIAFDHAADRAWLISTGLPEGDPRRRRQRAHARLRNVRKLLGADPPRLSMKDSPAIALSACHPVLGPNGLASNFTSHRYLAAVRRAIEYIQAGDCFQVNLAQRLVYPQHGHPLDLYARLRGRNTAPFAAYFDMGEFAVASASPERFLSVLDGEVETRPIKGTRPRGWTPEEDFARMDDLLESDKDRAENVMIVDLLRNDLGRVCEYGSIRVEAVCRLESFRTVHHLVSEVRGRLRRGLGPIDLLRAAFPGGSVTGAPKVRAMEIIAELEPTARGPYCGSIGYIGFDGTMDTNILIRTFTVGKGWVQFPVGGGIVADSTPEREYEETWHKAAGLLRALEY
jgi:para-aminobenzoate synthetase component 1